MAARPTFTRKSMGIVTGAAERNGGSGIFAERNLPRLISADVDLIDPSPHQPRRHFDEAELEGLANSIASKGLVQPITVIQNLDGRYTLVAGERRLRAVRILGLAKINAIALTSDHDAAELAVIENIQRVDLLPLEEAWCYRRLIELRGYDQETLAGIVGKSKTAVSRTLRLTDLPQPILDDIEEKGITVAKALLYELVDIEDAERCLQAWEAIKQGARREDIRSAKKEAPPSNAAPPPPTAPTPAALTRSIKTVDKHVALLSKASTALDDDQRSHLRELRAKIDALLSET